MSQRFKIRSFLRRTMNKVSTPKEKSSKERLTEDLRAPEPGSDADAVSVEAAASSGSAAAPVAAPAAAAASLPAMAVGGDSVRAGLERTVSELVHNVEGKKQEIAALKMEVKRLKVGQTPASLNGDGHS